MGIIVEVTGIILEVTGTISGSYYNRIVGPTTRAVGVSPRDFVINYNNSGKI